MFTISPEYIRYYLYCIVPPYPILSYYTVSGQQSHQTCGQQRMKNVVLITWLLASSVPVHSFYFRGLFTSPASVSHWEDPIVGLRYMLVRKHQGKLQKVGIPGSAKYRIAHTKKF